MRNWLAALLLTVTGALSAGGAGAQDVSPSAFGVSEVRGGIFAHSVDQGGPNTLFNLIDLGRIQDANVELLFTPPDADFWRMIGNPRPHIGATLNFGGLESMVYAGLTWHVNVFDTPVFIEGALGAALHNGALTGAVAPARDHGCAFAFHEAASIGYQFTENFSAMVTFEHASHAGLCGSSNRGLTNLGIRAGWTF
jgi:lipid A 3-O-deacylase